MNDLDVDLTGTRALITGGTSGLGLAMARALARSGAAVVLTSRSADRAAAAAGQLPGAIGIAADARDETSVTRAVERAWSRLGGIDMLVNNAGLGMITVNPRFMTQPQGYSAANASGEDMERSIRTASSTPGGSGGFCCTAGDRSASVIGGLSGMGPSPAIARSAPATSPRSKERLPVQFGSPIGDTI